MFIVTAIPRSRFLAVASLSFLLGLGLGLYILVATRPGPPPAGVAVGEAVPVGELPRSTPTPRLVWFQREPYGPVKVDPKTRHTLRLGSLQRGTQVNAVVSVTFNRSLSSLTGTPDIDLTVTGPSGVIKQPRRLGNGAQVSFQAPADGEYELTLSNEYSQLNAKVVTIQFLQP